MSALPDCVIDNQAPIACFGECMVELRSLGDGLWHQGYAGDACNTAVYLKRLLAGQGPAVCWAMGIGEDRFAIDMRRYLHSEGLDLSLARSVAGGKSGLYAIHVDEHGERQFSYWRDTSASRSYFDTPDKAATPLEQSIDQLQGLHFSAISLAILVPEDRARLLACANSVRRRGGWVSFDTNYRAQLWQDKATALHAMLAALDVATYVLVSMDEWQLLTGEMVEEAALMALRSRKCPELVIKRGSKDTWVCLDGAKPQVAEVVPVIGPVDTTAAGDAFAAGYLAARMFGHSPLASAHRGNQLASVVVMHPGAIISRSAMPDLGSANGPLKQELRPFSECDPSEKQRQLHSTSS